jgi:hypothetical protein
MGLMEGIGIVGLFVRRWGVNALYTVAMGRVSLVCKNKRIIFDYQF